MKIAKIERVGKQNVYDISVDEAQHYVLENGVLSHNSGILYSSNTVFMISRSQVKVGTDVTGYKFTINIAKSRTVREKSKFPFTVDFNNGIDVYSGLMEYAIALGWVTKPKVGWYTRPSIENDKNWRMSATSHPDFWNPLLENKEFVEKLTDSITLCTGNLIKETGIDSDTGELVEFEEKLDAAIEGDS